jgi:small subunit ribosomal protein S13
MARIEGVELPRDKRVEYGLTYLFGEAGIDYNTRVKDLTDKQVADIQKRVSKYLVEGDLRKQIMGNIRRLQEIACYRGLRHKKGLPARGQRTRTNARTRKGPRKASAIVALKRKITKK